MNVCSNNKKIVIIGASDLQNPLILKAKELDYETHVFAWEDGSIGERTADYFYPISITEKEKILEKCRDIKPDAVATIASDLANITVNFLARNLGLTTNSARCIEISTNKYAMRTAFKEAGISVPEFIRIDSDPPFDAIKKLKLPVIVKPTDRSGSRSITKLNTFDGLNEAVSKAVNDSFEKCAIIEEYIEGNEYSCECISFEGNHTMLAVTKKFTTGAPHFIEVGHLEPSDLDEETIENVRQTIFTALNTLEIKYGASHSEFKVDEEGNIKIIEIGSRMGGDCIGSDLVRLSTGYDFVKMVIDVAAGNKTDFTRVCEPKAAAIRYIFDQSDLDILEKVKNEYKDSLFFTSEIKPFSKQPVSDSSSRYGFFIVCCDSTEKCREICQLDL